MTDVENRVAPVQSRQGLVSSESLTCSGSVRRGSTAMPSRSVINRMAVGVAHIEQQPVAHLAL